MRKFFVLALSFFVLASSRAQEATFEPAAAVKWNYGSLYFGKISLFGEYNWKKKKSATFAIGIPARHTTKVKINEESRKVDMKSFSLMGGYRMYLGKKAMTGLYFEPYLKYLNNDAATLIDADLNGRTVDFATTSKYAGFGVGAQLGVQFMIAERLVFDFFFLGPEANTASHKVTMQDINSVLPWTASEAADAEREINDNIGDLPIVGKKLRVTVDAEKKTVSSDYSGFLPGLRFGLSIGVSF